MDDLIAAAAEAMNAPPEMVERSAEARAKASGASVEDVLRAWAGGGEVTAAPAEPAPEAVATAEAPAPAPAAPQPAAAASGPMDESAMITTAAAKMGMPESMVRRSLAARAKASGQSEEMILREWAGARGDTVPAPGAATPAPPPAETPPAVAEPGAPEPAATEPTPSPAPAPASGGDPAELLAAAAEKMGMPESMVQRSANARAKAQGVTVEDVLAEWAGVEVSAPAPAEPAPGVPAQEAPAAAVAAPAAAVSAPAAAPAAPQVPDVEVLGEGPPQESPPEPEAPAAPDDLESEEEAIAAGALPRWLAALFVFVPAFALAYGLFLPNGPNCGDAGSLAVDPVSGLAVNCDLSAFGEDFVDFFALGSETYSGIGCVACHGAGGAGVANFPAFTGGQLLTTFPEGQCSAQIEWVTLGTSGWPDETYGATAKPVGGSGAVMPGFAGTLDPEEIAAVAAYERVAFGGQDLDAALTDCGLAEGGDSVAASE